MNDTQSTAIGRLRAVVDHTELHALDDTVHTVDVYSHLEITTVWVGTRTFLAWARSIAAETVRVGDKTRECRGSLEGGQPVRVKALRAGPVVEPVEISLDEIAAGGEDQ